MERRFVLYKELPKKKPALVFKAGYYMALFDFIQSNKKITQGCFYIEQYFKNSKWVTVRGSKKYL